MLCRVSRCPSIFHGHILFLHYSVNRYLGLFYLSARINNTATDKGSPLTLILLEPLGHAVAPWNFLALSPQLLTVASPLYISVSIWWGLCSHHNCYFLVKALKLYFYLFCVYMGGTCRSTCMEVRGKCLTVGSFLPTM